MQFTLESMIVSSFPKAINLFHLRLYYQLCLSQFYIRFHSE